MYFKHIESSASLKAVHDSNQAKWAAERLKKVSLKAAAIRRAKKGK